ncbi:hypothetical protein BDY21DRAFT_262748, partial [Lineolata rhizophorae]
IIPLAGMLGFVADQLSHYLGEVFGGLLVASFANAPELILSVLALQNRQVDIVEVSLVGSVVSNALLVQGMAFCAACKCPGKMFNKHAAQASLIQFTLCVSALSVVKSVLSINSYTTEGTRRASYGISAILILGYCCYFYLQLKYQSAPQKADEESSRTQPKLAVPVAMILLILLTTLISFHSDFLVSSLSTVLVKIPATFVGLIMIPIIGNAAKHWTALREAYAGQIDLAMGVAFGSAVQVARFLFPVIVL